MREIIKLMRISHYIKNLLIFLPIFLGGKLFDIKTIICCLKGFLIFSFMSSIVYIINDWKDIEMDRRHPIKKKRPLASGKVSKYSAIKLILVLSLVIGLCVLVSKEPLKMILIPVCYLLLNLFYSFFGKNYPILDVFILMLCYVLRLLYGGMFVEEGVSTWVFLTMMSVSFFMGFGKRKNELLKCGDYTRKNLKEYTESFLNQSLNVSLATAIIFYAMTCVDKTTVIARSGIDLLWSVPIVVIICFRYLFNIEKGENDGDPVSVILGDKFLLLLGLSYGILLFTLIYIPEIGGIF